MHVGQRPLRQQVRHSRFVCFLHVPHPRAVHSTYCNNPTSGTPTRTSCSRLTSSHHQQYCWSMWWNPWPTRLAIHRPQRTRARRHRAHIRRTYLLKNCNKTWRRSRASANELEPRSTQLARGEDSLCHCIDQRASTSLWHCILCIRSPPLNRPCWFIRTSPRSVGSRQFHR